MKRSLTIVATALALTACQLPQIGYPAQSPAPLAKTTLDDRALRAAWRSFDAALDAINLAMDAKPSLIGTPGAIKLANAIDAVTLALTAAESAADAGSQAEYDAAIASSVKAFSEMRMAIAALKGTN